MVALRSWLVWLALGAGYWCCTLWFLFRTLPIFDDGYGLMPNLYWGNRPSASYPRVLYPYWIAAAVLTSVGCGVAIWLIRLGKPRRSRIFLISSATALFLLLIVVGVSDAGTHLHIWSGPLLYNHPHNVFLALRMLLPLALFTGLLAFTQTRPS